MTGFESLVIPSSRSELGRGEASAAALRTNMANSRTDDDVIARQENFLIVWGKEPPISPIPAKVVYAEIGFCSHCP
jgi:hypothetical protein